jgi:endoglucanase
MRIGLGHTIVVAVTAALLAIPAGAVARPDRAPRLGEPENVHTTVLSGQKAIVVTWEPPTSGVPVGLAYEVLLDGDVVGTETMVDTSHVISGGLEVGHTYDVAVRTTLGAVSSDEVSVEQPLYIAPVTTVQSANRDNPLAGQEWGVYLGRQDPAVNGWLHLSSAADREKLAPIAFIQKTKWFGRWITDAQAEDKTREYIEDSQAGDPDKLTLLALFRMFPWEGEARIDKRLPTPAEQAAYRDYVNGMAKGIGSDKVAVVLQPDGLLAKAGFDAHVKKVGRKKALLPTRMLAWTAKKLSALPQTTVYIDMGSEDWVRGKVDVVAKFLKYSGVKYARGFSLNVTHMNYMDREIKFAKAVSLALAKKGIPGKQAVLDTVDNGHPFAGAELNPHGTDTPHYTPPGHIMPCKTKSQKGICTEMGIPPTTDVDNPAWGLSPSVRAIAAKYVDAYLWVSRPWLPQQGTGGTQLSTPMASSLIDTWDYSPYFTGTP